MSACPSSTANGCKCPEHHEGLLAFAADRDAYEAALTKLRPVLRVVTMPQPLEDPCEGSYSCGCKRCVAQRAALMHTGRREVRQPWIPRRAA